MHHCLVAQYMYLAVVLHVLGTLTLTLSLCAPRLLSVVGYALVFYNGEIT